MSEKKTNTTDLNQLKNWFKTGSKPTQAQFWAWLNSFWHKDEEIPQDKIKGLSKSLEAKADADQLDNKANKDASGLSDEQKQAWKQALDVGELPSNIATIDEAGDDVSKLGNVYTKTKTDELLGEKLDIPKEQGTITEAPFVVGVNADNESYKLPAGDLGKNLGNTDLRVPESTIRVLDVTGAKFQVKGLENKSNDASVNLKVMQDANGNIYVSDKEDVAFHFPENFSATLTVNHLYPANVPPRPAFADDLRRILENYRSYQFTPITQSDWVVKTKENKGLSHQSLRTDGSFWVKANVSDFNIYDATEVCVTLTAPNIVLPKNRDWILKMSDVAFSDHYHGQGISLGGVTQGDTPMGFGIRGGKYSNTHLISTHLKSVSGRNRVLALFIKTGDIITILMYRDGQVAYHSQTIMPEFGDFSPKVILRKDGIFTGSMEYKLL